MDNLCRRIIVSVLLIVSVTALKITESDSYLDGELAKFGKLLLTQFEHDYFKNKETEIKRHIKSIKQDLDLKNITVVGSQNVYDKDGILKEIRTIELSIPDVEATSDVTIGTSSGIMMQVLAAQNLGFKFDLYQFEAEEEHEEEFTEIYMSNDLKMERTHDYTIINKTIHLNDISQLEEDFKSQCKACKPQLISKLVFDQEKKLMPSKSSALSELYASIETCEGKPSLEVIQDCLDNFVTTVQEAENLDDAPEKLRNVLQQKYPDLSFLITTEDLDGFYMQNHFTIKMPYEYIYDDIHGLVFTVYGYNNTAS